MELNFDDDSLKPFEVLKKIELFFPDSINVKEVFDRSIGRTTTLYAERLYGI